MSGAEMSVTSGTASAIGSGIVKESGRRRKTGIAATVTARGGTRKKTSLWLSAGVRRAKRVLAAIAGLDEEMVQREARRRVQRT